MRPDGFRPSRKSVSLSQKDNRYGRRRTVLAISMRVFYAFVIFLVVSTMAVLAQTSDTLQRARGFLEHGQTAEAAHTLETFLLRDPGNADAWTLLGIVRVHQGEPAKAEECFHKALAIQPNLTLAQTNLGHLLLDEHRQSEAFRYLTEALRSDRGNIQLRQMLVSAAEGTALQQRANGDQNGALATLLSAKAEAPRSFPLLLDLSVLEDELRLFRDADRDVHEARTIHPGDMKALYAEAHVKMDLQDMPSAERDMRAYLKARPDDATAHYGLGRILQMTQHSDAAKAEFERSIALEPNQAESYYQIGQIALDNGDYTAAQQECRKALEHDPKHGGALTALGIAAFRLKQYSEAVQSLQAAVAAAPGYQPAHYYYGLALAKAGQKEASERELKVAAQMADDQNRREAQRLQLAPGASSGSPQH
jgi:tetratricopeptide (TPR) repeat protein